MGFLGFGHQFVFTDRNQDAMVARGNEKGNCKAETQFASQTGMGRAVGLVDALRGLELDVACH